MAKEVETAQEALRRIERLAHQVDEVSED